MKSNTKKYADELMADPNSKTKLLVMTKRNTQKDVARRLGYSSVEEMSGALDLYKREKERKRKRKEKKAKAEHIRRKKTPIIKREELGRLLEIQSGHGDRVRAAIGDRELGERVALENEENTRKIMELRELIRQLEKY